MSLNKVPLSPHLQVYRLPLVALVSISSRICFVANSIAYALFIIFLISIASGSEIYNISYTIFTRTIGKILSTFWKISLYLYMSNEIRHLFWDLGFGFELKTSNITGLIVIFGSFILTIFIFILGRNLVL